MMAIEIKSKRLGLVVLAMVLFFSLFVNRLERGFGTIEKKEVFQLLFEHSTYKI